MRTLGLVLGMAAAAWGAPPQTLQINRASIQQYEDGRPVLKPDTVTAGETLHFSFNLQGFARKEDRIAVSYTAQAFDPAGIPLLPALTAKSETTLSAQDRDWQPKLRGSLILPELLYPGEYKLHIQAKDEISGAPAETDLSFLVAGPPIKPSATLEVRNLDFYRDEEAEKPLETAAYRMGEEIHARFTITGYRHQENGGIVVSYGVKLTGPNGESLFENKEAAQDTTQSFYPKPYIPAQFGFTLKPGTPKGEYTLEVTAVDSIGNQRAFMKRAFRLE